MEIFRDRYQILKVTFGKIFYEGLQNLCTETG